MDDDLIPVPHLFTIPEISEHLQVSPGTIRRWIRCRELPVHVIGDGEEDVYRVSEHDLAAFVYRKRMDGIRD